ncbi:MAG: hypothetical protein Q7S21_04200 [archaeon]|nr:hypothetical protein [archaeon]
MNKNQIFIAFIILAMLGSTVAFAFFFTDSSQQPPTNTIPDNTLPTTIAYSAQDVPVKVYEVFPRMIITATTSEGEIAKINSAIAKTSGIQSFNRTEYKQDSANPSQLLYIAEFFYSPDFSASDVFNSLQENTQGILSNIQSISLALVQVPKTVTFSNADLNDSIDYTFSDQLTQAYVSIDTIKDDELLVSIDAKFAGKELVEIVSFEASNLSNQLEQKAETGTFALTSLENRLIVTSSVNYSDYSSQDMLEQDFNSLEDINELQASISDKIPTLKVAFNFNAAQLLIQDLNFALSSNPNIIRLDLTLDKDDIKKASMEVDFNELSTNISDFKQQLILDIKTAGFKNGSFDINESVSIMHLDVSFLEGANIKQKASKISSILAQKNYYNSSIKQPGTISPTQIQDYAIDSPIQAVVSSNHSVGELVEFDITFFTQRGKVVFSQAIEKEKA